jgi:shikimate kinase
MNLFLIGYRGSGKTTVAAALAERLARPWIDADAELEKRAGKSIQQIFDDDGQAAFRELESAVVAELAQLDQHIVALGGGAVLRDENRQALAGRGRIVWLQASPEALLARIEGDPTTAARRPNLTRHGGLAEIRTLLGERIPVYSACADLAIDVEGKSPSEIVNQIVEKLFPLPLGEG